MENNLVNKADKDFESIKHVDENGTEFWYARELMTMLEYSKWGNFIKVIEKAKESCKNSNYNSIDHFAEVGKMVKAGVADKEITESSIIMAIEDYIMGKLQKILQIEKVYRKKKIY